MFPRRLQIPPSTLLLEVEVNFQPEGPAFNSQPIDTRDWAGSNMPQFSGARAVGFPFVDALFRPDDQAATLVLQEGRPTFPIAEPPVLTWSDYMAIDASPQNFGTLNQVRIPFRFARLQLRNPTDLANTVYFVAFLRTL